MVETITTVIIVTVCTLFAAISGYVIISSDNEVARKRKQRDLKKTREYEEMILNSSRK